MKASDAVAFLHDADAQDDPRCIELTLELGDMGYGIYWKIVERMRSAPNLRLTRSPAVVAHSIRSTLEATETVLGKAIQVGLFATDDATVWAPSLVRRIEAFEIMCEKRREAGRLGGLAKLKQKRSKGRGKGEQTLIHNSKDLKDLKEVVAGVRLTDAELERLQAKLETWCSKYGVAPQLATVPELLEFFSNKKANGYTCKDDRAALDTWGIKAYVERVADTQNKKVRTPGYQPKPEPLKNRPEHKIFTSQSLDLAASIAAKKTFTGDKK